MLRGASSSIYRERRLDKEALVRRIPDTHRLAQLRAEHQA